jgi:hypothetical protein
MDVVIVIILGAVASLIASEAYANAPKWASRLIQKAVLRLPDHARARYHEEWLAHMEECPGNLQKVWHGMSCCYFASPALSKSLVRQRPKQAIASSSWSKEISTNDLMRRLNIMIRVWCSPVGRFAYVLGRLHGILSAYVGYRIAMTIHVLIQKRVDLLALLPRPVPFTVEILLVIGALLGGVIATMMLAP